MRYSHLRVECHNNCPYQYKLRYVEHIKTVQVPEADLKQAIEFYYSNYSIINDNHINEVIKFEYLIPKIHEILANVNVYKKELERPR